MRFCHFFWLILILAGCNTNKFMQTAHNPSANSFLDSLLKAQKETVKKKEKEPSYTRPSGGGWLNSFLSSSGLQVFLWTLAVLFVLFILYKLFLTEGAFRRKLTKAKNTEAAVEEEVITSESDFDALVRQALQQGNVV
jgi:hypothetical protein